MNAIMIRQEKPEEFSEIHELVKTAFQTAKVSSGTEQDLVSSFRAGDEYIPELALVALLDDKIVGHIMLTRTFITGEAGKTPTLLVAPLSVELQHRNKGIGSGLINQALGLAAKYGHKSAVLVGDPAYYRRFGFTEAASFGIFQKGIPPQYVLAKELVPGGLSGVSGNIEFNH